MEIEEKNKDRFSHLFFVLFKFNDLLLERCMESILTEGVENKFEKLFYTAARK